MGRSDAETARILAIDVSNVHTALALWQGDRPLQHWQLASEPRRPPDEYEVVVHRLLARAQLDPATVAGCVMACVVPALGPTFSTVCRALFGRAPLAVGPGVHAGLRIRAANPREVGADRIANAVAASARWGQPVMVLDFSTALTLDVVGADGDYLGAVIAPGIEVAADALARRTAQLWRTAIEAPPRAIATDTEHSLQSGLLYGYVGLIEGLVKRARAEVGSAPVIATGEAPWVKLLLDQTSLIEAYEPLLTLDGLRRIYLRHLQRG